MTTSTSPGRRAPARHQRVGRRRLADHGDRDEQRPARGRRRRRRPRPRARRRAAPRPSASSSSSVLVATSAGTPSCDVGLARARRPSPRGPRARRRAPCGRRCAARTAACRKWTPSTSASTLVALAPSRGDDRGVVAAAEDQARRRSPAHPPASSRSRIAAISSNSPEPRHVPGRPEAKPSRRRRVPGPPPSPVPPPCRRRCRHRWSSGGRRRLLAGAGRVEVRVVVVVRRPSSVVSVAVGVGRVRVPSWCPSVVVSES